MQSQPHQTWQAQWSAGGFPATSVFPGFTNPSAAFTGLQSVVPDTTSVMDPTHLLTNYQQFCGNVQVPTNYDPSQWTAAQMQHWQQWQQWQQKYQQWEQQYGKKYEESIAAYSHPPPSTDNKQNEPLQFNQKSAPPLPSVQEPVPPPPPADDKTQNAAGYSKATPAKDGAKESPEYMKDNPEDLSEAEKIFDVQFKQWEDQFIAWKEQNINHPDKQQYKEYEKKWETWREQLLQRREQMRKKRLNKSESEGEQEVQASTVKPEGTSPATPAPATDITQSSVPQEKKEHLPLISDDAADTKPDADANRNQPPFLGQSNQIGATLGQQVFDKPPPVNFSNRPGNFGPPPGSYGNQPVNYGNQYGSFTTMPPMFGPPPGNFGNTPGNYQTGNFGNFGKPPINFGNPPPGNFSNPPPGNFGAQAKFGSQSDNLRSPFTSKPPPTDGSSNFEKRNENFGNQGYGNSNKGQGDLEGNQPRFGTDNQRFGAADSQKFGRFGTDPEKRFGNEPSGFGNTQGDFSNKSRTGEQQNKFGDRFGKDSFGSQSSQNEGSRFGAEGPKNYDQEIKSMLERKGLDAGGSKLPSLFDIRFEKPPSNSPKEKTDNWDIFKKKGWEKFEKDDYYDDPFADRSDEEKEEEKNNSKDQPWQKKPWEKGSFSMGPNDARSQPWEKNAGPKPWEGKGANANPWERSPWDNNKGPSGGPWDNKGLNQGSWDQKKDNSRSPWEKTPWERPPDLQTKPADLDKTQLFGYVGNILAKLGNLLPPNMTGQDNRGGEGLDGGPPGAVKDLNRPQNEDTDERNVPFSQKGPWQNQRGGIWDDNRFGPSRIGQGLRRGPSSQDDLNSPLGKDNASAERDRLDDAPGSDRRHKDDIRDSRSPWDSSRGDRDSRFGRPFDIDRRPFDRDSTFDRDRNLDVDDRRGGRYDRDRYGGDRDRERPPFDRDRKPFDFDGRRDRMPFDRDGRRGGPYDRDSRRFDRDSGRNVDEPVWKPQVFDYSKESAQSKNQDNDFQISKVVDYSHGEPTQTFDYGHGDGGKKDTFDYGHGDSKKDNKSNFGADSAVFDYGHGGRGSRNDRASDWKKDRDIDRGGRGSDLDRGRRRSRSRSPRGRYSRSQYPSSRRTRSRSPRRRRSRSPRPTQRRSRSKSPSQTQQQAKTKSPPPGTAAATASTTSTTSTSAPVAAPLRRRSRSRDRFGRPIPKANKPGDVKKPEDTKAEEQSSVKLEDDNSKQDIKNSNSNVQVTTVLVEDLLGNPGRSTRPPKMVFIMRGLPGSGKTYLARLIKEKEVGMGGAAPRILSLDDYFMTEVEKEDKDDSGRKTRSKVMEYEYEAGMEKHYRSSLVKAFKKTISDGFFNFTIIDSINEKASDFEEMWSFAKQKGFQVYIAEMDMDVQTCVKRNVHKRTEKEITELYNAWEETPKHHLRLDIRSLLQSAAIDEVEMEVISDNEMEENTVALPEEKEKVEEAKEEKELLAAVAFFMKSKWDSLESSEQSLDRLDGLKRRREGVVTTMEDYLQLPDDFDDYNARSTVVDGSKKRVRWADLEERRQQEKMRAIGFIVGQTDWRRMTDPSHGESALTRTKYI